MLGDNIRKHRLAKEMSLNKLSKKTGISKSQLSRIELGENKPSFEYVVKIAAALKLDIKELSKCV